ncbi:MAG: LuxR C-terminal-related transcriptional regulator [Anaerolineaceae bacterium]
MRPPVVRENLVHRQRLTDQIEEGIEQGFILVSAPPGYGKTTLVADWVQQNASSFGWLTLDANDNEILTLSRYVRAIFEKFFPNQEQFLDAFPLEGNTKENFQAVLNELINQCSEATFDLSLVLDDYQVIANPEIHQCIAYLLDHFPAHLRLILITRSDPPFSLSRFRANHRIVEFHAPELAFSLKETGQFLNQTQQLNLTDTDVANLYSKTEGWITGLQLASLTQDGSAIINQPGMSISGNANLTIEYMVDEVINRQPSSIKNFLLRTSVLDNLYGPLCDYILEPFETPPNSRELLHTLYHSNLFLTPLDREEHWFRYHSLFGDALRHLLTETYPDEVPVLYSRAVDWCDQNGFFNAALTYATILNDRARLIDLLEKYSIEAVNHNQILDIFGLIQRTDENLLASSPILSLIYSWGCLLYFDIDAGEIWLNRTIELMEHSGVDSNSKSIESLMWGLIAAEQSILASANGDMKTALEQSMRALSLLPEENDFSHSFALLNHGLTLSINGEVTKAIRVLTDTIRISHQSGNWVVMTIARSNLGEILIDNGQLSEALILFEQSIRFLSSMPGKFTAFVNLIYKEMADIYLARNQLAEAEQSLLKCLATDEELGSSFNDFDTHVRLAHLYQCQGNVQQSKHELSLARQLSTASQARLDDLILDTSEAKWALLRGQVLPTQKLMQKLAINEQTSLQDVKGIPFVIADNVQLVIARYFLTQGQLTDDPEEVAQAVEKLKDLLPLFNDAGLVEHQIEAYALLALAYHALDQVDDALAALQIALQRAEPEEFRQIFLDEGIPMSRLLIHYLSAQKQNKLNGELPSRAFVSDLLFRLTGKETDRERGKRDEDDVLAEDKLVVDLLTARENEVLQMVARGRSNNEVALNLHISVNTVKRHLNNVFMKLGVSTRTQAIRVGQQRGLIQ